MAGEVLTDFQNYAWKRPLVREMRGTWRKPRGSQYAGRPQLPKVVPLLTQAPLLVGPSPLPHVGQQLNVNPGWWDWLINTPTDNVWILDQNGLPIQDNYNVPVTASAFNIYWYVTISDANALLDASGLPLLDATGAVLTGSGTSMVNGQIAVDLISANRAAYVLQPSDIGGVVTVQVIAFNNIGASAIATSNSIGPILA